MRFAPRTVLYTCVLDMNGNPARFRRDRRFDNEVDPRATPALVWGRQAGNDDKLVGGSTFPELRPDGTDIAIPMSLELACAAVEIGTTLRKASTTTNERLPTSYAK